MKPKYRKAVFILAYSKDKIKKEVEYLLLKRKLHWKGWEFPKGAIEKGESMKETLKRELKEETGLKALRGEIKKFNIKGKYLYDKIYPDRFGFKGQTYEAVYAIEVKKGKIKLDKYEHSGHKWASFKQALKMLKWPNQKKSLKIVNGWLMGKK